MASGPTRGVCGVKAQHGIAARLQEEVGDGSTGRPDDLDWTHGEGTCCGGTTRTGVLVASTQEREAGQGRPQQPSRTIHALDGVLCVPDVLKLNEREAWGLAGHPDAANLAVAAELQPQRRWGRG